MKRWMSADAVGIMSEEKGQHQCERVMSGSAANDMHSQRMRRKSPNVQNGNGNHTRVESHHSSQVPDDFHTTPDRHG